MPAWTMFARRGPYLRGRPRETGTLSSCLRCTSSASTSQVLTIPGRLYLDAHSNRLLQPACGTAAAAGAVHHCGAGGGQAAAGGRGVGGDATPHTRVCDLGNDGGQRVWALRVDVNLLVLNCSQKDM